MQKHPPSGDEVTELGKSGPAAAEAGKNRIDTYPARV